MRNRIKQLIFAMTYLLGIATYAQDTEIHYLSGTGLGNTVTWDFYCSAGMNSGKWSKIEVPSQWELQGFGEYTYGRFYKEKGKKCSDENGLYRQTFRVPSRWKDKQVNLVFEGVMTDTEVKVNGHIAGSIHQGGFYQFSYDITDKLIWNSKNDLEIHVWKQSADQSVNRAERMGDWWLFGGIYRPVYLQILPKTHIKHVAINATADGLLQTDFSLEGLSPGHKIVLTLTSIKEKTTIGKKTCCLNTHTKQTLKTYWAPIKVWDCEHPNLYTLKIDLLSPDEKIVHTYKENIGFRTVEFRYKDGIYVNGTKIILKGTNRHSFHPDGGRTTNHALSLQDAILIKQMNMNAVRSHYPPDKHFLNICDSIGLFYIDEFVGWHNKYTDSTALKLLPEMLNRDVNHPCIILWSNGNEGGWNKNVDKYFAHYDPQKRHVIHPWADYNGIDTHHYPTYQMGTYRLTGGNNVFMPTEISHGLYDGGQGAGFEDYWNKYTTSPLFAGCFLWAYVDEAVRRSDKKGILDSDGPNAPDGIVGPYREKEGSFYTIREIWSPIQVEQFSITSSFKGIFGVKNAWLFTNMKEGSMNWQLSKISSPLTKSERCCIAKGEVTLPAILPGEIGKAHFSLPKNFLEGDILELEAYDQQGNPICNWTFPTKDAKHYFAEQVSSKKRKRNAATIKVDADKIYLSAKNISALFDTHSGKLIEVHKNNTTLPFSEGPLPIGMKMEFKKGEYKIQNDTAIYTTWYTGTVDSIVWKMTPDGMLGMEALILNRTDGGGFNGAFYDNDVYHLGFSFSYPENVVNGMQWFGRGPYRVWKNRIKGSNYGLWQKAYNNTVTGEYDEKMIYPEFKGYHANLYWATLESSVCPFTVYSETDGLYFRIFTPQEPIHRRYGKNTMIPFPVGDLSFLFEIPAMQLGKAVSEWGPSNQPSKIYIRKGDAGFCMKLWFQF